MLQFQVFLEYNSLLWAPIWCSDMKDNFNLISMVLRKKKLNDICHYFLIEMKGLNIITSI